MQLTSSHTVHCLQKTLTVQPVWESVVSSRKKNKKVLHYVGTNYKFHVVKGNDGKQRFWSYMAVAGQEDLCSHVESITFTNRIIRFPRGTETIIVYCPPPLLPLNDGISLLLLHFRGKRESLGERADTGQSTAATSRRVAEQTSNGRFLDLLCSCKRQESQQCQLWQSEFTSHRTVATLFKLVKSWYMENDIKPPTFQVHDRIRHGTGSCT